VPLRSPAWPRLGLGSGLASRQQGQRLLQHSRVFPRICQMRFAFVHCDLRGWDLPLEGPERCEAFRGRRGRHGALRDFCEQNRLSRSSVASQAVAVNGLKQRKVAEFRAEWQSAEVASPREEKPSPSPAPAWPPGPSASLSLVAGRSAQGGPRAAPRGERTPEAPGGSRDLADRSHRSQPVSGWSGTTRRSEMPTLRLTVSSAAQKEQTINRTPGNHAAAVYCATARVPVLAAFGCTPRDTGTFCVNEAA